MQTRGAWSINKSNPANANKEFENVPAVTSRGTKRKRGSTTNSRDVTPTVEYSDILTSNTLRANRDKVAEKHVAFEDQPTILESSDPSSPSTSSSEPASTSDKENTMAGERPKLKLKLTNPSQTAFGGTSQSSPPPPQSAVQTPSIKLSIKKNSISSTQDINGNISDSSAKKRKRSSVAIETEDEQSRPAPVQRRQTLTLKPPVKVTQPAPPPQTPGGILKLTAKAKVKKRPLGVGYDSESEQTELDPVIIEGFILRMQPGPDCDYMQEAIKNGTMGLPPARGGANVSIRLLDTHGRRAMLCIKEKNYAATLVDLPCIIEGMKSWNGKEFIKSMDICQMMMVLGRCKDIEEARNYPLPDDVNPHNYQYADGITAPMKHVRKRRFARTRRARVDEIESVERRVQALLQADVAAEVVKMHFEALDVDPRDMKDQDGEGEDEYDEEDDEEGEDADGEPEDYFDIQRGHGGTIETPYAETPQEVEYADEDDFAALLGDGDGEQEEAPPRHAQPGLLVPDHGDSSFAVTSTSASPSAVDAAATPASQADGTTDDDDGEDEDKDDAEKEDDEQKREALNNIAEYEKKIEYWMNELKRQTNHLLRKTAAGKIKQFEQDVKMEKRKLGIVEDEEEGDE